MAKEVQTEDSMDYAFHEASPSSAKCTLRFKVKTAHDAHVCLSSSDEQDATPFIEIFLGGWDNSKCAIRRDRAKPDRAEAETPDTLSADEARGFWISWDSEGKIEVGREGEEEAFMSYTEPEPFEITHYGVRTAWGANGDWEIEGASIATVDSAPYQLKPAQPKAYGGGSLVFGVKADHDAHVALTNGPALGGCYYEVFIGGWNNGKCALRKNGTKPDLVIAETPNILNSAAFHGFTLSWKGGLITLQDGKGGVIFEHQDSESIPISHYGIRTSWGARGEWKLGALPPASAPADFEPAVEKEESQEQLAEGEKEEDEEEKGEEEKEKEEEEEEEANEEEEKSNQDLEGGAETPGEACWVAASNGDLPDGAVCGGTDQDCDLYIARAVHEGELVPGKFVPSHGVAYISWNGAEVAKEEYEVLCGCKAVWKQVNEGEAVPENALPGGRTGDGETLFVGRVPHENTVTVGKVHTSHGTCYIPYGGQELGFPDFEVLVRQ